MGPGYEFIFLDGAYPCPPAAGIEASFGRVQAENCLSYYDGTAESAAASVRELASYLGEYGPFDCVLCFSLGTAIISTLLLCVDSDPDIKKAQKMAKSAVFICGILPQNWESLKRGQMEQLKPDMVNQESKIRIRTVHAYSHQDAEFLLESKMLLDLCARETKVEVTHSAGHEVPKRTNEIVALAKAMTEAMEKDC